METNADTQTTREPRSEVAFRHPVADDETICESVFTAVASAEDCSVLELDPLAETIDTDALNALFPPGVWDDRTRLRFQYAGYTVVVGDDEVTLHPES